MRGSQLKPLARVAAGFAVMIAAGLVAGTGPATATGPADPGLEASAVKAELEREVIADLAERAAVSEDPRVSEMLAEQKAAGAAQAAQANAEFDAELAQIPPEELCGEGELTDAAPIGSGTFLSNGGHAAFIDGECVAVYAGQAGLENPDRGAVFVMRGVDMAHGAMAVITTEDAGSLTIESVDGGVVRMTSNDGRVAAFRIAENRLTVA
jgi:flagellar motor protein MotB